MLCSEAAESVTDEAYSTGTLTTTRDGERSYRPF